MVVLESSPILANVLHAKKDYALTLEMAKEIASPRRINDKPSPVLAEGKNTSEALEWLKIDPTQREAS